MHALMMAFSASAYTTFVVLPHTCLVNQPGIRHRGEQFFRHRSNSIVVYIATIFAMPSNNCVLTIVVVFTLMLSIQKCTTS